MSLKFRPADGDSSDRRKIDSPPLGSSHVRPDAGPLT